MFCGGIRMDTIDFGAETDGFAEDQIVKNYVIFIVIRSITLHRGSSAVS